MKRALLVLVMLAGCGFAQKHPGVTVGIVAGSMGFGACELSVAEVGTCSIIGGSAGLVLGGITALVTLIADTEAHELAREEEQPDYTRVRTKTAPPPGLPDAGVPVEPPPADAGVPAEPTVPGGAGAAPTP